MSKKSTGIIIVVIAALVAVGVALYAFGGGNDYSKYTNDKYFKLGEYKGLSYKYQDRKVTKKDVQDRIKAECEAKSTLEDVKKGKVDKGDTITMSYEATVDGNEFTACKMEKGPVTIGAGTLIGDMEDKIIGMEVGDTKEVTVKLPDDYQDKKVRGKEAKAKVKVYTMQKANTPKYDIEFVKKYTGYKTTEDYEKHLKKQLKEERRDSATTTEKTDLMNQVMTSSKVKKYPSELLKAEQERIEKQYKEAAKTQNVEWKDFLKNYVQMSEKDFDKFVKTSAKNQVKWHLVIEAIAKKENLKITDKEMSDRLKKLLKDSGFTEKTFKEQYKQSIEEYAKENDLKASFLEEKVRDFMYKNAKPTK